MKYTGPRLHEEWVYKAWHFSPLCQLMTMDKNFVDKFLLNSSNSSVSHVAETIKARSIPNTPYNLNIDVRSLQSDRASYLRGFTVARVVS